MEGSTKSPVLGLGKLCGILPAALLAVGCMGQPEDNPAAGEDAPVGALEQAFPANWGYSWGVVNNSSIDIGTSIGRTCFLTGVTGDIQPAVWPEAGLEQTGVTLTIDPNTKDYHLNVTPIGGGWNMP